MTCGEVGGLAVELSILGGGDWNFRNGWLWLLLLLLTTCIMRGRSRLPLLFLSSDTLLRTPPLCELTGWMILVVTSIGRPAVLGFWPV